MVQIDFAGLVTEFIGTFALVLSIGSTQSISVPVPGPQLAIGLTLMVMIYSGGYISGGHYNPAVTLGVLLRGGKKISPINSVCYLVVQIIASLCAAWVVFGLFDTTFTPTPYASKTDEKHKELKAVLIEALWTFVLVSAVLHTGYSEEQQGNYFFGMTIGFTVLVGALSFGNSSGAVFNPAVATGPGIVLSIHGNRTQDQLTSNVKYMWIYWVGPLVGGALAAGVYRLLHLLKKMFLNEDDTVQVQFNPVDTGSGLF
eukprot:TRINITY_DN5562_c0_g1_i2.p1 TRINITY_DN5562_c0_g1~~TRINITY_DN5562_c0_g1_i2.p1  ORF type:complete len:257 (-),score=40.82 TRINITY_DN5562_c0_g1_i2:127-897(-)